MCNKCSLIQYKVCFLESPAVNFILLVWLNLFLDRRHKVTDQCAHTASARPRTIWSFADVDVTMELNLSKQDRNTETSSNSGGGNSLEEFTYQSLRCLGLRRWEEHHHKAPVKWRMLHLWPGCDWQHCPVVVTFKGTPAGKTTADETCTWGSSYWLIDWLSIF